MFPHYFQVVKVAEVEVVMMKAMTVESTVMTTMIWILDLHLAVPHLVVLVEIGLFVCLNLGFISEYIGNFIHGHMTRSSKYPQNNFLKFIHIILMDKTPKLLKVQSFCCISGSLAW